MSDSLDRLLEHVRQQASACEALGSPFYAALLTRLAEDLEAGGPSLAVLEGHADRPGPDAVALRLLGVAHRLALSRRSPELAAHFPSTGGDGDPESAWVALRSLLDARPAELREGLELAPQTNETGRAAALLGALLQVAGPEPVRLWEIGASAGLNLLADRFRYRAADGQSWGRGSPVELDPAWDAVPEGAPERLEVVERVAGDVSPVDPTSAEGALRLESFVWPDQLERLERLRGALELAREVPVRRERATAPELLDALELVEGTLTVVWHSVMWQYVPREQQERTSARIEELGTRASSTARFAHIAFEPRRLAPGAPHRFLVSVRQWPAGEERILGEAPPHGAPVRWGPPEP